MDCTCRSHSSSGETAPLFLPEKDVDDTVEKLKPLSKHVVS